MIDDKTLPTPRPEDRQVIQSYGEGRFRVSNATYEGAVLILPDRTVPWPADAIAGLAAADFAAILAVRPPVEILLLGCGKRAEMPPAALRRELRQAGIVMEVMDTGGACRTYNVLLAEGRRVAAALLPLP